VRSLRTAVLESDHRLEDSPAGGAPAKIVFSGKRDPVVFFYGRREHEETIERVDGEWL
jgi:hypothetical protein